MAFSTSVLITQSVPLMAKSDKFNAAPKPPGKIIASNSDAPNSVSGLISPRVINTDVEKAIQSMHSQHKVIGALCIAPVLLAKLLPNAELTIGQDEGVADAIVTMGASHHKTNHAEIVIDEKKQLGDNTLLHA